MVGLVLDRRVVYDARDIWRGDWDTIAARQESENRRLRAMEWRLWTLVGAGFRYFDRIAFALRAVAFISRRPCPARW
jgi:hypothetical protein